MILWLFRKLFRLLVVLFTVSLFTFHLCKNTPGTPAMLRMDELKNSSHSQLPAKQLEELYLTLQQQQALDKPLFYIGLGTLASPDTLFKACKDEHLPIVERWIARYGNWSEIEAYYQSLTMLKQVAMDDPEALLVIPQLFTAKDVDETAMLLKKLQSPAFSKEINRSAGVSLELFRKVQQQATPYKAYIPVLHWYGTNNMYHQYMKSIINGNFGYSTQKHKPVLQLIVDALKWSLITGFSALILTYMLAIPLGVYTATYPKSVLSKIANTLFYVAYSLPVYWIATLMIIFVASSEYLDWFPAFGTGDIDDSASWLDRVTITAYHLVLPVICWTYSGFAYLSLQVQASMQEESLKDYMITARAKGLPERRIIWRHAFPNASMPVVTLLGLMLPGLISGAVVIENIFSIPGMGKLIIEALQARDYPVLYMITLLTSLVSVFGLSISDLLAGKLFPSINANIKV